MKGYRKLSRIFTVLLVFTMLFSMLSVSVLALDETPDMSKIGSITVTMRDIETKKIIPGGSLTLYRVVDLNLKQGGYELTYCKDFENCKASLADLKSAALPETLLTYVDKQKIKGTTQTVDKKGTAVFKELPVGLYLIAQTKPSDAGTTTNPFLVLIPTQDEDGIHYDVNASPKPGTTPTPPPSPTPTPKPPPYLPQTGQLWWPVPILAMGGLLFLVIGLVRRRRKTYEEK